MRYLVSLMVFSVLLIAPTPGILQKSPIYLSPPGLRPVKDPAIVVPVVHQYLNQPPAIPEYRNEAGEAAEGWTEKYIATRRFSSDKSAWIYYRISNLADSQTTDSEWSGTPLRIWPAGTVIVLESYRGNAAQRKSARLVETVVMHKTHATENIFLNSFYPANWNYARFTPKGNLSNTPEKVAECHQCHSIAFRLTGDLVFTQFP